MTPAQILLAVKIGLVGVLLVVVFMFGHRSGVNAVQGRWDADKAQRIAAQDKLIQENERHNAEVQATHDAYNVKVSEQHGQAISELNKKYDADVAAVRAAGGLRIPRAACSGSIATGTETTSTSGRDADTTGTIALPEQITSDLLALAAEADRTTEVARTCQSWIRLNGFYGPQVPQ